MRGKDLEASRLVNRLLLRLGMHECTVRPATVQTPRPGGGPLHDRLNSDERLLAEHDNTFIRRQTMEAFLAPSVAKTADNNDGAREREKSMPLCSGSRGTFAYTID